MTDPVRVAFVCVANAGRSQMAAAFADRELERRDLEGQVEVLSGGTDPADAVHDVVVAAMSEVEADLRESGPRAITPDELAAMDLVVTMGCSAEGVCPATWRGDARDWDLDDPEGRSLMEVRGIREEIRDRVAALFDEFDAGNAPS